MTIPFYQKGDAGASPAIRSIGWNLASTLLKKYHYLKSRRPAGIKKCFGLIKNFEIKGVAVFTNTRCREWDNRGKIWELARFALTNDMPKNSESWFLAKLFKILRKDIDFILAYSDPEMEHNETIYRASGFKYLGQRKARNDIFYLDGKKISARTMWDKFGTSSISKLEKKLGDRFYHRKRLGKLVFIKELKRNGNNKNDWPKHQLAKLCLTPCFRCWPKKGFSIFYEKGG